MLDYRDIFDKNAEKRIGDRLGSILVSNPICCSDYDAQYVEDISYMQDIVAELSIIIQAYEMKIKKLGGRNGKH